MCAHLKQLLGKLNWLGFINKTNDNNHIMSGNVERLKCDIPMNLHEIRHLYRDILQVSSLISLMCEPFIEAYNTTKTMSKVNKLNHKHFVFVK